MSRPVTPDERRKQEAAEKMHVIEARIEMRLEDLGDNLGTELWSKRKAELKALLTAPELRQLDEKVQSCRNWHDAHTAIVNAIDRSRKAHQAAEDARLDTLCAPPRLR